MHKVDLKWEWTIDKPYLARIWCREQFGSQKNTDNKYVWRTRDVWGICDDELHYNYFTCFYFEKEEHRDWFIMRWS